MNYLKNKLTALGWSQDEINNEIHNTYHEILEVFLSAEDDNYISEVENIISENLGVSCSVTEIFDLYETN